MPSTSISQFGMHTPMIRWVLSITSGRHPRP